MASAHGCDTAYMRCIFHALGSLYDPPNVFKHSVRKLQRASRQPFLAYICLLSVMCCQTQNTLRPQPLLVSIQPSVQMSMVSQAKASTLWPQTLQNAAPFNHSGQQSCGQQRTLLEHQLEAARRRRGRAGQWNTHLLVMIQPSVQMSMTSQAMAKHAPAADTAERSTTPVNSAANSTRCSSISSKRHAGRRGREGQGNTHLLVSIQLSVQMSMASQQLAAKANTLRPQTLQNAAPSG